MPRNRRKKVNKQLYLKIRRDLIKMAKEMGYQVIFTYRKVPVSLRFEFKYGIRYGYAEGNANTKEKVLRVWIKGRPARRKTLLTLAHEVRHAIHAEEGLFKDYYRPEHYKIFDWFYDGKRFPKNYKRSCLKTAFLAELDCDRWAYKYLKEHGIDLPRPLPYPYYSTMSWKIENMIKNRKRRRKR